METTNDSKKQIVNGGGTTTLVSLPLALVLLLLLGPGQTLGRPDLYTSSDDVLLLNGETFKPTVFEKNKDITFVVQFFNTYCGHCQHFAPVYKELATRVRNWTSVARIAGVDCSITANVETCSENRIDGYPTIYIFPPNSKFNEPKDAPLNLRSLGTGWTVDDLEESIIAYVSNLTQTNGRHYPKAANAMQAIEVDELSQIHRLYTSEADFDGFLKDQNGKQDLMFIVESDKSFLGRALIMEYFRLSIKLELRRILLDNTKLLRLILKQKDYEELDKNQPLLIRMNSLEAGSKAQVLVKGELDTVLPTVDEAERSDFIRNRFKSFLDHYYSVELKELFGHEVDVSKRVSQKSSNEIDSNGDLDANKLDLEIDHLMRSHPVGSKKIFAQDLLKGISYMLTHEIRIKGDVKPDEFNTIRNLLTILRKYLPLERWDSSMKKFVETLRTKLDENRKSYDENGLKSQQMKDLLDYSGSDEVRLKHSDKSWLSCHESERQRKGYTCSLWLLFHTLTVGEYTKAAPVRSRPTLVLATMRDYITKFLGCTVCSSNFVKETENLESHLVARNSSTLWLWMTHNRVNQRLNNERPAAERKALSQVVKPSHKLCPECYATSLDLIGIDGKTLADIEWNQTSVLNYLVAIYKPDNVVSPNELGSLLRTIRGQASYNMVDGLQTNRLIGPSSADLNSSSAEKWNIQSIFSTSDMSLCLLLYLFCIGMVAIVCFSLNPQWRRMNKIK